MLLASVLGNALAMAEEEEGKMSLNGHLINIHQPDNSVREYDLVSGTRRTIYQLQGKYSGSLGFPIVKVGEEAFIIRVLMKVPTSGRQEGNEARALSKYGAYMLLIEDGETHNLGRGGLQHFSQSMGSCCM